MQPSRKVFSYSLIILILVVLNNGCLNRHFIDGRSELVSVSDTALNDSSIFIGYVHQIDWPDNPHDFEIQIENSMTSPITQASGYYYYKTIPGIYSLRCKNTYNEWDRLVEVINNVEIKKNQKIRIDFYLGYTVE